MTSIAQPGALDVRSKVAAPGALVDDARPAHSYLEETTIRSWLLTRDHKRIGILFFFTTAAMLLLGGVFALLLRLEHLGPGRDFFTELDYNRLFSLHGVIMVWLFMIPSIPAAFGNFFLPIMVGAREVAFPRLNLASFYIYLLGAAIVLVGAIAGGLDTGWTFYPPYSTETPATLTPVLVGIFIVGWSTIITGINFIVTVHTMRAKGVTFFKMPLFVWGIYGTSIIQVFATPVLAAALILVGLDHLFHIGLFDPARGGDPLLYEHIFWFYSHPAVYIMVLPAMGVVSEVVTTFARQAPYSYKAIAYSSLGIAFVGFFSWGHHLFTAGISEFGAGAFGIFTMLVAVFSAIKVSTWVSTLYGGTISVTTPLVYIIGFLFLFAFGGMTGVALSTVSLDVHWQDTYFVVAHFHFIMVGGTLTAYMAALHYWFPKVTGRMYAERWGLVSAVAVITGFIVTFVPQFLLGNDGMPRRYATYDPQFQTLHVISTVGSWILAGGLVMPIVYLTSAALRGPRAPRNPWRSQSYEWDTSTPPPKHNFETPLLVEGGPYDYGAKRRRGDAP